MSSTWDESRRVMRNLGDIIDAVSRVIVVDAEVARDEIPAPQNLRVASQ